MPILTSSSRLVVARFQLVLVTAATCLTLAPSAGRGQNTTVHDLKARFLFGVAKFVEWPPDTFPTADSPLAFGIMGDDFVGYSLYHLVRSKTINERPLQVHVVNNGDDLRHIQVLFIGQSQRSVAADVMKGLSDSTVLTVSDVEGFCDLGGMIRLFIDGNRVRFDVNLGAAERARLKVSSRVLTLAKAVHGKGQ